MSEDSDERKIVYALMAFRKIADAHERRGQEQAFTLLAGVFFSGLIVSSVLFVNRPGTVFALIACGAAAVGQLVLIGARGKWARAAQVVIVCLSAVASMLSLAELMKG